MGPALEGVQPTSFAEAERLEPLALPYKPDPFATVEPSPEATPSASPEPKPSPAPPPATAPPSLGGGLLDLLGIRPRPAPPPPPPPPTTTVPVDPNAIPPYYPPKEEQ
jgi:hypothetical protein